MSRNRIFSDKQKPNKQQEEKPSYQQNYYGLHQKQNQIANPQQVKKKLTTHELDRQIHNQSFESQENQQRFAQIKKKQYEKQINMNDEKKKNIIIINQQQNHSNHLNQKILNPKLQKTFQQQNNLSFYVNNQQQQIKQQTQIPQQIVQQNQQSKSINQRQNIHNNFNIEPRKQKNQIKEIESIYQDAQIKVKKEQYLNEDQNFKLPQVQEKRQPKKQFERQLQEPKENDVNQRDRQLQDAYQVQDYDKNRQNIPNMTYSLETQDSQNEQNNILDSNISILRTFNLQCFDCNLKIESICIQTPCQHSFHKNCINDIMNNSLLKNGFQINCKCTEKLPQYFIRNHNQELFQKLLEQQIKKIENDQIKNDYTEEKLLFHPNQLLKETQQQYENEQGMDILKCYYLK